MSACMKIADESFRLVLNETCTEPSTPAFLIAARNDTASFQIILRSDKNYSVNVSLQEWASAKYRRLLGEHERLRIAVDCPFEVKLYNEGFLTDDDESEKADIILHQNVRESRAKISSAVWADVIVPVDAVPGEYTVTVRLFASLHNDDETVVDSVTLPLRVADYVLSCPTERKFHLDLWQHTSNIARRHDVPLWSDAHFNVLRNYVRSLASLGQKAVTVCVSERPWSGQHCFSDQSFGGNLFEYSMIGIKRKKDGSLVYDYSVMQRYINLCAEFGICGEIEVFGLVNVWTDPVFCSRSLSTDYPEDVVLRCLDESDGCMKYIRKTEEIEDYIRSLEKYFIDTDQIDRVRIAADEPGNIEKYRKCLETLARIAPRFCYKTAINHAEFIEEFGDRIDDFVPYLDCALKQYDRLRLYRDQYPEKRFLWYVCCGGARPNSFLRSAPIESRAIGMMTSVLGFDGFLRWNYAVWPDDPRNEIRYSRFEAGDTNFVYPAYNGEVLLSLRYKNLKRGLDDYALIEHLREKRGGAEVDRVLSHVLRFTDIREYIVNGYAADGTTLFSMDFCDYNRMKAEILAALAN